MFNLGSYDGTDGGKLEEQKHPKRKRWIRLGALAVVVCAVGAGTAYALSLPASTLTGETYCGKEEHVHGEACYEKVLICGKEETTGKEASEEIREESSAEVHQHTESCYETQRVLVCTQAEGEGHTHTEACYETQLVCGQEEREGHTHTETCYDEEGNLICELPEDAGHTHSEACYEQVLICGQQESVGHVHDDSCYQEERVLVCQESTETPAEKTEESAEGAEEHVHTEACYEKKLICQLEEHTHSKSCYSNPAADVESASDWEQTLPQTLTGDWAKDVIEVAVSQLGYAESKANYIVLDDGKTKGYTRYGAWYGDSYGDWCAMFVSFCLHYAQVEGIPLDANCADWIQELNGVGLYQPAGNYVPKAGQIIFFDWDQDGSADHVGLVAEVGDGIRTIEGNSGNRVQYVDYALDDSSILGYGLLPGQEEVKITKTAQIYTDDTYTQLAEEDETVITLTGVMPEDAEVLAYKKDVDVEQLICAYDIVIRQADGTDFEPDEEHPIEVHFQLSEVDLEDLEEEEQDELAVCYVPEEGEAQPIVTEHDEEGLSFSASHFSTYAVVAASTTGVSTLDALRNAFTSAENGDVIQLTGDITIGNRAKNLPLTLSDDKAITLDLNGHSISISVAKTLFQISNGSLTITDSAGDSSGQSGAKGYDYKVVHSVVSNAATGATTESTESYTVKTNGYIMGGSSAIITVSGGALNMDGGMLCEGTGRAIEQSGGTVNLSGGYICRFTMNGSAGAGTGTFGGAVKISGGTLNLSGTVLAGNEAPNGGAIYNAGAEVNMTGGVISGNTATRTTNNNWNQHSESSEVRCGGGGIYADGASVTNVSGGYISCNTVADTGYFDGGGGIFFSGTSTVNFTGGYITGNTAPGGGGIRADFRNDTLGQKTTFNMSGNAFLSGNTATAAEGGGANLDRNCSAIITSGYITNNQCTKGEHWGGGGVFCADGATLTLENGLITNNTAGGFGAGIGGCSTGRLYLYVDQGCAIYDNTSCNAQDSPHYATGGAKEDGDVSRVKRYPSFLQHGNADFFCALRSAVIGGMLGNSAANWEGTADGVVVSPAKDEVVTATQLMGLTAHPTAEAKQKAQNLATLYVNGNSSYTHGGGIMCNGNLIVGIPEDIVNPVSLGVTGTKQLLKNEEKQSLKDKTFTFQITDSKGTAMSTGTTDENGTITFDEKLKFDQAGTYTYYVAEVTDSADPAIVYDGVRYKLDITVVKDSGTPLYGDTVVYNHLISQVLVSMSVNSGQTWTSVEATLQDGVLKLPEPNGATFTNRENDVVEIPVKKVWKDDAGELIDPDDVDSVFVILYQDGKQKDRQELNKKNNWSYTWKNLEKDHTYEVKEEDVEGYTASYETEEDGTVVITNTENTSYVLPETGGNGTFGYTIGGLLLLAGGLLYGYVWKGRKEGRHAK